MCLINLNLLIKRNFDVIKMHGTTIKIIFRKVEENNIANGVLLIAVHSLHGGVMYVLNIVFYGKRELRPYLCRVFFTNLAVSSRRSVVIASTGLYPNMSVFVDLP
jgi:hypothetical protein